jgi:hypothetical protein
MRYTQFFSLFSSQVKQIKNKKANETREPRDKPACHSKVEIQKSFMSRINYCRTRNEKACPCSTGRSFNVLDVYLAIPDHQINNKPTYLFQSLASQERSVLAFNALLYRETYEIRMPLGRTESVSNSEVSSFQGAICN